MPLELGENSISTSTIADQLTKSLKEKIEDNTKNNEQGTREIISRRVPNMLRDDNAKAYTPSVVSIGPLHNGSEENLKAMEADKVMYTRSLLKRRDGDVEKRRKECEAAILGMQDSLKKWYPDLLKENVENVMIMTNLLEMMLIDGCFIIELVYRHHSKEQNDPILHNPLRLYAVRRDLLLLENQIPFCVLEKLFSVTVPEGIPAAVSGNVQPSSRKLTFSRLLTPTPTPTPSPKPTPTPTLIDCLLSFFRDIMGLEDTGDFRKKEGTSTPYHILHLLHICYLPPPPPVEDPGHGDNTATQQVVDIDIAGGGGGGRGEGQPVGYQGTTTTQLRIAGIKLRKRKKTRNLFDVKFSKHDSYVYFWRGRLEIPRFSIHNFTESFLRNLIAFEQCFPWIESYFTSHAFLMDILMDSVEDVQLLEKEGIICNHLGTSDSVLKIFNGICRNAAVPPHFHYGKQWDEMKSFRKTWRKELATLKRNCAGNLWILLSIIAGIVLFTLTLVQTIYAILAYQKS